VHTKQISFPNNHSAQIVILDKSAHLEDVPNLLGIDSPKPVVVLVGGASGLEESKVARIRIITDRISQIANDTQAIVIDGGTQAGVMECMGQSRRLGNHSYPLLGVVVEKFATWPEMRQSKFGLRWGKNFSLEPNHSHFILVPGKDWGDESEYISRLATLISGDKSSVTVLINGGEISRQDVANSLAAHRLVIVMRGSGRLADEIAAGNLSSPLMNIISMEDTEKFLSAMISNLKKGMNHDQ
jgi:hypothetical protein